MDFTNNAEMAVYYHEQAENFGRLAMLAADERTKRTALNRVRSSRVLVVERLTRAGEVEVAVEYGKKHLGAIRVRA